MAGKGWGPATVPKMSCEVPTLATQSLNVSLMASLRAREPEVTGITVAPGIFIRATLTACRRMPVSPM